MLVPTNRHIIEIVWQPTLKKKKKKKKKKRQERWQRGLLVRGRE